MIPEGLTTRMSSYGPRETMDRLAASVAAHGMTSMARIDHASGAAKAGMKLRPTEVLIFGNPKSGTPLMQAAQTMGIDLPLRALVWQDEAEKTWVAYNDPTSLAERHGAAAGLGEVLGRMTEVLTAITRTATSQTEGEASNKESILSVSRPPVPPFTRETAIQKVHAAEDGWNTCDAERVALAYTEDSHWRNRAEFLSGRPAIIQFLKRKWVRELEYRLIKELWAFDGNRIAVRFAYEFRDDSYNWFRAYGNENWEFEDNGLMRLRYACINDLPIKESERKFHWDRSNPRPSDHHGLTDLGL
jgi:nuclear transport factor 2 (NTF2) superfamily protein/uncharacterized protein (DUF302 family)